MVLPQLNFQVRLPAFLFLPSVNARTVRSPCIFFELLACTAEPRNLHAPIPIPVVCSCWNLKAFGNFRCPGGYACVRTCNSRYDAICSTCTADQRCVYTSVQKKPTCSDPLSTTWGTGVGTAAGYWSCQANLWQPADLPSTASHLQLDDLQMRPSGSCATNWTSRGHYGITAYTDTALLGLPRHCPYVSSDSSQVNGYRYAVFDTKMSMVLPINWANASEYSVCYLSRMTGDDGRILQASECA